MRVEVERLSQLGPLAAYRVEDADFNVVDGDRERVVFLHGFTQTAHCIGALGPGLARSREVVSVDLPGHGASREFSGADLWRGAELVARTTGAGCYIGYSMGGRLGLHLALAAPEKVTALVLIGATAGIADRAERELRAREDSDKAARVEAIGIEAFVSEWLDQPLFSTLPAEAHFEAERLRNSPEALAASLRNAGTGSMDPLWDRLGQITCPVLVVAGELDPKFTAIGSKIVEAIGSNSREVVVAGAGHSVHLEQPARCLEVIEKFLDAAATD